MRKFLKASKIFIMMILAFSIVTACSNDGNLDSKSSKLESAPELAGDMQSTEQSNTKDNDSPNSPTAAVTNRKLIKTADLRIETKKFENTITELEKSVANFNGYIEANHITGTSILEEYNEDSTSENPTRSAEYTIRIPSDKLTAYLNNVPSYGNVISKSISSEDVSNKYFDTETRVKSLKIQEERLLNLLKKSGKLSDIIELEKELTTVRYEIESLTTTLKTYDSLVNYSTVNLSVIEVAKMTDTTPPKTVSDRISAKFEENTKFISDSLKNTTVFVIGNSLLIIFWLIILTAGYFITRKVMKKYQDWNIPK